MTIQELMQKLPMTLVAGGNLETQITGGYASDLLSNVMGQAQEGDVWITMQGHQNIIAVSLLAGIAAVIIAGGAQAEPAAVEKADKENLPLLTTDWPAYQVAGELYRLGIGNR